MSRTVILTVLLVLSGCSWTPAGGQTCSLSGKKICSENLLQAIVYIFTGTACYCIHAAAQFSLSTITVRAESVDGSTPAARVTWNTTIPPQCVVSVTVEFRTPTARSEATTYTATNTSQTEFIQTGLQCTTYYYITVVVTRALLEGSRPTLSSRQVQVFVGGNKIVYMRFNYSNLILAILLHRCTIPSWSVSESYCRQHKYQSVMAVVTTGCAHVC